MIALSWGRSIIWLYRCTRPGLEEWSNIRLQILPSILCCLMLNSRSFKRVVHAGHFEARVFVWFGEQCSTAERLEEETQRENSVPVPPTQHTGTRGTSDSRPTQVSCWILSYQAAAILDLKRGWTGIRIAKKANDHCCATFCNNDKRYDSVKIYLTSVFPGISRNESARHL